MTKEMEQFRFNTSVARMMEFYNAIAEYQASPGRNRETEQAAVEGLLCLMAPLAPHFTEEMWERLGHRDSIHHHGWPEWDDGHLKQAMVEIPVQVNGKLRDVIAVPMDTDEKTLEAMARDSKKCRTVLDGRPVKKIVIKNKLINFVC